MGNTERIRQPLVADASTGWLKEAEKLYRRTVLKRGRDQGGVECESYRFEQRGWIVQWPAKSGFNLGCDSHSSNERSMTAPSQHPPRTAPRHSNYASVLLMFVVGLLALWRAILPGVVPYNADSASYIEQARSILAGNGFESRPDGGGIDDIDVSQRPSKWFPPGYPLVIAAGSAVSGVPVEAVAPWISRIALIILPLTVFLAFRPVIGVYGAVCLGILGGLSPGVIRWGDYAASDLLSLTLALTSFGLTLGAWSHNHASRALLLALGGGLLAGFAYLTRNANMALLLAVPLSMGVWFFVSPQTERATAWRVGLSWALGASIIVLPWLARNVMVFGTIQPYEMPPSTVGAWPNLRIFIEAQIFDVLGSRELGRLVGWSVPGLVTLLVVAVVIGHLSSKQWSTFQSEERRAFVLSLMYAVLGATIVIAARTKYEWGDSIQIRNTMQYTLFFLLPAAILLRHLLVSKNVLIALTLAIMVSLTTLRFLSIADAVNPTIQESNRLAVVNLIDESRPDKTSPCAREPKPLLISNYAFLYRILCDANSRYPGGDAGMGGHSIPEAESLIRSRVGHRPVMVALHPGRGIESSDMPLRDRDVEALVNQGWVIKENSPMALVLVSDWQASPETTPTYAR